MKKVAIITLTDNNNYGNRLQNYALQESIKKCGFDAYTLWNKTYKGDLVRKVKEFVKKFINLFKDRNFQKRVRVFSNFTKKYIKKYHSVIYTKDNLDFLNNKFDKFVIGSDQIWNYNWRNNAFGVFEFAKFAPRNKCISYAPSFGMNSIPKEKCEVYKEGINHVKYLSVREEKGVDIIQNLTGRKAEWVLDPVMLLDQVEWEKILKEPKGMPKGKFLLTYFIGGMNKSFKDKVQEFVANEDITIINLNDRENRFYYVSPNEFLYLIKNAEIILTDSFHACVFSIIFQKAFYVLDREDYGNVMNSRIDTLLERYELKDRKISKKEEYAKIELPKFISYLEIEKKIKADKEKSFQFLKEALKEGG